MGGMGSSLVPKAEAIRGNGLNTHVPPLPHVPTVDDSDAVLDQPDDVGWTLRERIKAADELLTGSPTKSELKAVHIGLATHRDRHQEIVKALARLEGAMK